MLLVWFDINHVLPPNGGSQQAQVENIRWENILQPQMPAEQKSIGRIENNVSEKCIGHFESQTKETIIKLLIIDLGEEYGVIRAQKSYQV